MADLIVHIDLLSDHFLIHHTPIPQWEEANVLEWVNIGTLTNKEFQKRDTASIDDNVSATKMTKNQNQVA